MNEVWHFSRSNKNQRKFHGVQFNFHWKRLTKANHCIRISGCSASNQRPTKKAGNGMVLFLSVLGFYMIAKWTWIMGWHGVILRDENFTLDLFWRGLWIYSENIQPPDGDFWMLVRNLDACAELASGNIMSGFILVTWYPRRTRRQASPALYQRSGCMKDTLW